MLVHEVITHAYMYASTSILLGGFLQIIRVISIIKKVDKMELNCHLITTV
jgi:hypothetical protein